MDVFLDLCQLRLNWRSWHKVSNFGPTVIQGVLLPPVRLMSSDMIENFIATEDYAVIAQRKHFEDVTYNKNKNKNEWCLSRKFGTQTFKVLFTKQPPGFPAGMQPGKRLVLFPLTKTFQSVNQPVTDLPCLH